METKEIQTDAHLLMLMQWLKDNDESGLQAREHANDTGELIVDQIAGTESDL